MIAYKINNRNVLLIFLYYYDKKYDIFNINVFKFVNLMFALLIEQLE